MNNKNIKHVVLVNQDSGYLTVDIANSFQSAGFEVSIISGRIVERTNPLNPKIQVRKIIKYNRKNMLSKIKSWVIAFFQSLIILKKEFQGSQVLIVSNPPFATFIPIFVKNKCSILIFDYYVNLLEQIIPWHRFSLINFLWKKAHYYSYAKVENIFVLTPGMLNKSMKFTDRKDIQVVELWADNVNPLAAENDDLELIKKYDLKHKFVITYSGNIGLSSGVDFLIKIAELLKDNSAVFFLIMGEGTLKSSIEQQISSKKLSNCLMTTWKEPTEYSTLLSISDLAYVSLISQDSNDSIPSKLYTYIAHNLPVLCIAETYADISLFVTKTAIGENFTSLQLKHAAQFISDCSSDKTLINKFKNKIRMISTKYTKNNASIIVNSFLN